MMRARFLPVWVMVVSLGLVSYIVDSFLFLQALVFGLGK